jgi:hypothetical protein
MLSIGSSFSVANILLFHCVVQVFAMTLIVPHYFRDDNRTVTLEIEDGPLDVYGFLHPNCHLFKSESSCEDIMNDVSSYANKICDYTPRLPDRTIEDSTTSRGDIVMYLADRYNATSYLEIGCANDDVFGKLRESVRNAVGIDPERGGTHRMTSDTFFELDNRKFDLIFIDGDHNAKQVIIDVQNSLRVLSPGGTIVMHDCNPLTEQRQMTQEIPVGAYNGDTWKVIPFIRLLQDVEVVTLDLDHGVAVLRRRPNMNRMPAELEERMNNGSNPIEVFTYSDLVQYRADMLRLVTVAQFRAWLDSE